MPLRKIHELTLLWFGLPGPLLNLALPEQTKNCSATFETLRCKKVALFLPPSCGYSGVHERVVSKRVVLAEILCVATPAEPRGEKKTFFVQILGGEELLKFVEKCR